MTQLATRFCAGFCRASGPLRTSKLSYFTEIQVRDLLTESYGEPAVIDTIPMGPGDSFDSGSLSEGADAVGCSETEVYPAWTITLKIGD